MENVLICDLSSDGCVFSTEDADTILVALCELFLGDGPLETREGEMSWMMRASWRWASYVVRVDMGLASTTSLQVRYKRP